MSLEEEKVELHSIITEKLEDGTLDKFVRRIVEDEDGNRTTQRVELTDPSEYLEYLSIERI